MPDMGGGYRMNPQVAQAAATQTAQAGDTRITEQEAGYLELPGAQKDADCGTVNVAGGVSSQGGCCNVFDMIPDPQAFSCGNCTKIKQGAPQGATQQAAPVDQNSGDMPAGAIPGEK